MSDIVWIENHDPSKAIAKTREDGVTEFEEGVPYKCLPVGIQFEVLEEHYEGDVRYIDKIRLLALSVRKFDPRELVNALGGK